METVAQDEPISVNPELDEDAEYRGNKEDQEDLLLTAQRYLNIYHQIHIFKAAKRREFNQQLLDMPEKVRRILAMLPGGRILLEYMEELEAEKGIQDNSIAALLSKNPAETPAQQTVAAAPTIISAPVELSNDFTKALTDSFSTYSHNLQQLSANIQKIAAQQQNTQTTVNDSKINIADTISTLLKENSQQQLDVLKNFGQTLSQSIIESQKELLASLLEQQKKQPAQSADNSYQQFDAFKNFGQTLTQSIAESQKEFIASLLEQQRNVSPQIIERTIVQPAPEPIVIHHTEPVIEDKPAKIENTPKPKQENQPAKVEDKPKPKQENQPAKVEDKPKHETKPAKVEDKQKQKQENKPTAENKQKQENKPAKVEDKQKQKQENKPAAENKQKQENKPAKVEDKPKQKQENKPAAENKPKQETKPAKAEEKQKPENKPTVLEDKSKSAKSQKSKDDVIDLSFIENNENDNLLRDVIEQTATGTDTIDFIKPEKKITADDEFIDIDDTSLTSLVEDLKQTDEPILSPEIKAEEKADVLPITLPETAADENIVPESQDNINPEEPIEQTANIDIDNLFEKVRKTGSEAEDFTQTPTDDFGTSFEVKEETPNDDFGTDFEVAEETPDDDFDVDFEVAKEAPSDDFDAAFGATAKVEEAPSDDFGAAFGATAKVEEAPSDDFGAAFGATAKVEEAPSDDFGAAFGATAKTEKKASSDDFGAAFGATAKTEKKASSDDFSAAFAADTPKSSTKNSAYDTALLKIKEAINTTDTVSLDDLDIKPVSLSSGDSSATANSGFDDLADAFAQSTDDTVAAAAAEMYSGDDNAGDEWEYVDEDGNPVTPSDDDEWEYVDEDGNPVTPSDDDEWEYVDEDGNPVAPSDDDEWEYVDENGNPVAPSADDEWEYVDENGNVVA